MRILTIGFSLKLPVFSVLVVWIIFMPKLCIILPTTQSYNGHPLQLVMRERRLHCWLLVLLVHQMGGIERGEEGERRHWRIKCLLSSLTQKCNLQQEKMFGSSSVPNVFNHPVSPSLLPPGKVAQCMTEQGKNWPGMNESVFVILSSNGR